jgi:guanylate kinase
MVAEACELSVRSSGVLLVVSGPSGVGKGTVLERLLERHPELSMSVSCTTRAPRPGEQEGRDYHFISPQEFQQQVAQDGFLEYACVHANLWYGTPRKPIEEALQAGHDIALEIDYQGARSVRQLLGGRATLVFIAPPSWEELVRRLRGRSTETEEATVRRMASARMEFRNMGLFEYIVINDRLDDAVDQLESILIAERHRLHRTAWRQLQGRLLAEDD